MHNTIILSFIIAIFCFPYQSHATDSPDKKGENPPFANATDSLSYSMGVLLGEQLSPFSSIREKLNPGMIADGLMDALSAKTKITQEEASSILNYFFTFVLPQQNQSEGEEYLENIKNGNPAIQETPSGLLYEIIIPGNPEKIPTENSYVVVNYTGSLPNGDIIDSSYDKDGPVEFQLNSVIEGWTEALQLIGEGGKINIWLPSSLAYGQQGAGIVGPNQAISFEIDLLEVKGE